MAGDPALHFRDRILAGGGRRHHRAELPLTTGTAQKDDQRLRDGARDGAAQIVLDERQGEIDAGRYSRRCVDRGSHPQQRDVHRGLVRTHGLDCSRDDVKGQTSRPLTTGRLMSEKSRRDRLVREHAVVLLVDHQVGLVVGSSRCLATMPTQKPERCTRRCEASMEFQRWRPCELVSPRTASVDDRLFIGVHFWLLEGVPWS